MAELLEFRQRRMKERQQQPSAPDPPSSLPFERHYSVAEVASMWNLSEDVIRELFEDEPGVFILGSKTNSKKRRYVTLRIPATVVERVYQKRANARRTNVAA
ncbi:MAG TPA: hypothetical protein VFE22_15725 [Edaphobacter sp.]|nr:hypothetical protein [Edaphobacter sp.]